jgi:hypothetical protein
VLKRELGQRVNILYFLRDLHGFGAPVWKLFTLALQLIEAVPHTPDVVRPERLLDIVDAVQSVITLEEIVYAECPAKALTSALNTFSPLDRTA